MALRRALAIGTGGGYEQIPDADTIRVSRIGALSGTGPSTVTLENAGGNTLALASGTLTLGSGVALASGGGSPALSGFGTATFGTKVVTPEVESSGNMTLDANSGSNTTITLQNAGAGALSVSMDGDVTITGNLVVQGTMTTQSSSNTSFSDNHLYLNAGYETAVAQTGGLVVNYLPLSTNDTVAATGFTAGVAAVSNPTVKTAGSGTFAVGQFIQIAGANNAANNGLFEVLSHVTTTLTIRGVGTTATVEDFTDNQVVTDTTVAGTIREVNVSVIRAGTDGNWETGKGAATGITFTDLASATGTTLQQAYENGETIQLSDAEGDLKIGTDDTGTRANFILENEAGTANYLATNSTSTRLDLGSSGIAVNVLAVSLTMTGNPTVNAGTGTWDFDGNLDANAGVDVVGNFTHGTSGSGDIDRPWDFSAGVTNSAGEHLFSGGNLQLNDTIVLSIGTGDDLRLRHDATNSFIESLTGDLIIDNQVVTGMTLFDLGTDTTATVFKVRDNSLSRLFEVMGDGEAVIRDSLDVGATTLPFGNGAFAAGIAGGAGASLFYDPANPTLDFSNAAGSKTIQLSHDGMNFRLATFQAEDLIIAAFGGAPSPDSSVRLTRSPTLTGTTGEQVVAETIASFAPTSGTAKFVSHRLTGTVNQTGTATGDYTILEVDVTETAATGTNKRLADFKRGGTTQVYIDRAGNVVPGASGNDLGTTGARWDLLGGTGDFSGAVTFGTTLTVTGVATFNGAVTLGDAAADVITVNGTTTFVGVGVTTTFAGDITVNGGDFLSTATTFNFLNTTVTTLNIGGASIAVEIGAATGTTSINNNLTVDGNTTLGDASASDTLTLNARLATLLEPTADDAINIGSITRAFREVFAKQHSNNDVSTGVATSLVIRDTVMVDAAGDKLGQPGNAAAASFTAPLGVTTTAVSPASVIPLAIAGVVSLALGTGQTIVRGEAVRIQSTGGGGTAGKVEKATGTLVPGTLVSGDYEQVVAIAIETQATPGGNFLARLVDRPATVLV